MLKLAFNSRWSQLLERGEEDSTFREDEAFEGLLGLVQSLADAEVDYDHESGPGQSSSNIIYFTKVKSTDALARFAATDA